LQRIDREFRFVPPKTERSRRRIALSNSAVKALLVQRRRQAAERLAAGPGWQDLGLVFTMSDGAPIERKTLYRDFKRILRTNGLPNIRFHDLRHSTVSLLLAQGVHPRIVMELLGHSQISLTMDTYSHVMPSMMRAAVDSIDEVLGGKS
jgi:integrase